MFQQLSNKLVKTRTQYANQKSLAVAVVRKMHQNLYGTVLVLLRSNKMFKFKYYRLFIDFTIFKLGQNFAKDLFFITSRKISD